MRSFLRVLSLVFGVFTGLQLQAQATSTSTLQSPAAPKLVAPTADLTVAKKSTVYPDRIYKSEVAFTLLGRRYDDPFVNARWSRLVAEFYVLAKHQDWLEAKISLVQLLTSGSASYNLGVTEQGPSSGLVLDEASLKLMPTSWLMGKAGVLRVDLNPVASQYFMQNQAGAQVDLKAKTDATEVTLSGSQTIPTSKNSSNVLADEGTNALLTVGSLTGVVNFDKTKTAVRASVAHYEFTDLSSAAAADAQKTGSTVVGVSKDFNFFYEYRGKEYALAFEQGVGLASKISLKGSLISNELAPAEFRDGTQLKLEYTQAIRNYELIPSVSWFRLESDALPSLYTNGGLGYSNRYGKTFALRTNFPKEKFMIFASYTEANPINAVAADGMATQAETYQADRQIYTIGAEAKYDIF